MELDSTNVVQVAEESEEATPQFIVPHLNLVVIPYILQHMMFQETPCTIMKATFNKIEEQNPEDDVTKGVRKAAQNLQRRREVETYGSGHP
jgi:hypothetical protein